ncbi:hypothetical protein [Plesiomonas shigelloides]|uniref:hypothetical protein n=1 Tax=Plesiomonas shigelloides TaxID=703 RepID=UPI003EBD315E
MILLRQRKPLTGIQKQIRQLKAQIELVQRDRSLSPAEKRERIDRMMAARNKLVSQAVKISLKIKAESLFVQALTSIYLERCFKYK